VSRMENRDESHGALLRMRELLGRARPIGALVGLGLLVAAVALVANEAQTLRDAWSAVHRASSGTIVALIATMAGSVFLTGVTFWLLTRRFGRVGLLEMQALMAATALANYLPLRPGLIGRVLYHRARNDIRARDSIRTIVEAMLLSVVALALLVPAMLVGHRNGLPVWFAALVPLTLAVPAVLYRSSRQVAAAFIVRYAETLLTTLRYDLAFRVVGAPLPWHVSAAIACVSMIATMVPFVSNGIGLREWAIGLLAPVLADVSLERGLVAELAQRAIEVAVIVPAGLLGSLWLWRSGQRHPSP
jgi:hypothetical protein